MLAAVDFNNQPCLSADEVGYVSADRVLSLEFPSIQPAIPNIAPESAFTVGQVTP